MNYLKEMNAFYNKLDFQPLSGSAVALWHTLMHFNNRCAWKKEFSVAAGKIRSISGVKGGSFSRAREELQANGLIRVTSRGANQAALYQMISQIQDFTGNMEIGTEMQPSDVHMDAESGIQPSTEKDAHSEADRLADRVVGHREEQSVYNKDDGADNCTVNRPVDNTDDDTDNSPVPLVKQEKYNKQDKTNHNHHEVNHFDVFSFYQENFGFAGAYVQKNMQYWIQEKGEELVMYAMKRALEQNKATWGYVKGILNMWSERKITSVQQAEADDVSFRHQNQNSGGKFHRLRREVVPDWFDERKKENQQMEQERPVPDTAETEEEKAEFEALLQEFTGNKRVLG